MRQGNMKGTCWKSYKEERFMRTLVCPRGHRFDVHESVASGQCPEFDCGQMAFPITAPGVPDTDDDALQNLAVIDNILAEAAAIIDVSGSALSGSTDIDAGISIEGTSFDGGGDSGGGGATSDFS